MRTLACYDRSFQAAGGEVKVKGEYEERNRVLLKGQEPLEEDLWVVPQYPLWDPQVKTEAAEGAGQAAGQIFPFQMDSEPLPNEAWVKAYRSAAPRIQCFGRTYKLPGHSDL